MAHIIGKSRVVLLAGSITAVALAFTGCSNSSTSTATSSQASAIASEASSAASEAQSAASEAASAVESAAASAEASMSVPAAEASALASANPADVDALLAAQWAKFSADQQAAFCTEYKATTPAEAYKTWSTAAATEAGMTPEAFAAVIPQAKFEAFYAPKCA